MVECDRLSCKVGLTTETQHHPPIILHVVCWVALRLTQPTDYFTESPVLNYDRILRGILTHRWGNYQPDV